MRDPALLDADIAETKPSGVARDRRQVRAALEHRHDVLGRELGRDPLVLAPHPGAPRLVTRGRPPALVEQLLPGIDRSRAQRGEIVNNLEEIVAPRAAIDDLTERIGAGASGDAAKLGSERHARTL